MYEASLRSVTGSSDSSLDGLSSPSFTSATVVNSQGITSSAGVGETPVLPSVPVTWRSSVGLNAAAQPFSLLHSTRPTSSPHSAVYHPQVLNSGSQVHHRTIEQPMGAAPSALYGIQVPPVSKYSGNADSEPFEEWLEQFELVASVCNWEGRTKLANLVTRLQGQAYSFYRTCSAQQQTSYDALKDALSRRFKPVRIQSVQSGLFHERKQKPQESVEDYAQDMKKLYQRAYPQSERGSEEAERIG